MRSRGWCLRMLLLLKILKSLTTNRSTWYPTNMARTSSIQMNFSARTTKCLKATRMKFSGGIKCQLRTTIQLYRLTKPLWGLKNSHCIAIKSRWWEEELQCTVLCNNTIQRDCQQESICKLIALQANLLSRTDRWSCLQALTVTIIMTTSRWCHPAMHLCK